MSGETSSRPGFYGYPESREGPETGYTSTPGKNPVVRGLPLALIGSASVIPNLLFHQHNTTLLILPKCYKSQPSLKYPMDECRIQFLAKNQGA